MKPLLSNSQVALLLHELADLATLDGEHKFKVAAYRRAAKFMEGYDGNPLTDDLTAHKGIGRSLADRITDLAKTGMTDKLYSLRQRYPDVSDLALIPGVGMKTAFKLYESYRVTTRTALQKKLRAEVKKGRRDKDDKLLANLAFSLKAGKRLPRLTVERRIRPIVEALRPLCSKIKVAGSIRRKLDTVKDVDILVVTKKPKKVLKVFHSFGRVATGEGGADTALSSIFYEEGRIAFRVDLVLISASSWGAGLCYFTGSKSHNVALRARAKKMGMILNQNGLFKLDGDKPGDKLAGKTEKSVYRALSLPWFPPEIREDYFLGLFALENPASRPKLPRLVRKKHLEVDLHTHTVYSDGKNTVDEMVAAAVERGLRVIGISDHMAKSGYGSKLMDPVVFRRWMKEVKAARKKWRGQIRVLAGAEVDISYEGTISVPPHAEELDYWIASCHTMPNQNLTKRFLKAMTYPRVRVLGHPTGRAIGSREEGDAKWDLVFKKAAALGVALEINGQGQRLDLPEYLVRHALSLGCKVALTSDAHAASQIRLDNALAVARRGGATAEDVILADDIPILLRKR